MFLASAPTASHRNVGLFLIDAESARVLSANPALPSELFSGWTDPGDIALAGDFLGYGHDQLLLINNDDTPPTTGRLTIIDFVGQVTQDYVEHYGDSDLLDGWTLCRWVLAARVPSTCLLFLPY